VKENNILAKFMHHLASAVFQKINWKYLHFHILR